MGKKIFSGVQPTGNLHLGNYLGAIKNFVDLNNDKNNKCIFCVVDLHAITVRQDPKELKNNIRETVATFIASGIDPKKSVIFNQSSVAAHAEGAWILSCVARMGWLNRMTQFKEKAGKDKEKASSDLQGMLSSIEQETPLGKIQADYEARLELIEQYENTHTDMLETAKEARLAVEQSYMDAKRDLMLTQGEELFGSLAGLSKAFVGEQSGVYRALFAIEKSFALASAAISTQEAVGKAMEAGFPLDVGLTAKALAQGAKLVGAIQSITPKGFKAGGYTGNMGTSQVAGVVHGQEYVFDAKATKRIGVNNLEAMRSGKAVGGGDVNINVTVTGDKATVSGDNERMGRDMANGIKAVVMDVMRKEKRQGGLLYGA